MNPADPSYVPFSMFRRIFLCEDLLLISIAPRSLEVNDSRLAHDIVSTLFIPLS